jgi:squalene-hopene/tetraprenyl-beta-curcumene cyclase
MAAGDFTSECLARGIVYLMQQQAKDGSWFEVPYTGTGFPRVFYLKYTYYYLYFPLLALTKYAKVTNNF